MPDTPWFPVRRTTFPNQPRSPRREVAFTVTALAFVVILLVPQTSLGSGCPGGGKNQTNISVTTSISDLDSNGLQSTIASDGFGAYSEGVNGVTSILTVNGYNCIKWGDWQFDTYSSKVRAVTQGVLMGDAVQPGDPHYQAVANPPFWGKELLESHIEVKCTLINNDTADNDSRLVVHLSTDRQIPRERHRLRPGPGLLRDQVSRDHGRTGSVQHRRLRRLQRLVHRPDWCGLGCGSRRPARPTTAQTERPASRRRRLLHAVSHSRDAALADRCGQPDVVLKQDQKAQSLQWWSGQPGSNRRHPAWEADALPAELCPRRGPAI